MLCGTPHSMGTQRAASASSTLLPGAKALLTAPMLCGTPHSMGTQRAASASSTLLPGANALLTALAPCARHGLCVPCHSEPQARNLFTPSWSRPHRLRPGKTPTPPCPGSPSPSPPSDEGGGGRSPSEGEIPAASARLCPHRLRPVDPSQQPMYEILRSALRPPSE